MKPTALTFLLLTCLFISCYKEDPSLALQQKLEAKRAFLFPSNQFPFNSRQSDSLFQFSSVWKQEFDSVLFFHTALKPFLVKEKVSPHRRITLGTSDSIYTEIIQLYMQDSLLLPHLDPFLSLDSLFYQADETEDLAALVLPTLTQIGPYFEGIKSTFEVKDVPAIEQAITQYEKHFFFLEEELMPYLKDTVDPEKWGGIQPVLEQSKYVVKDFLAWLVSQRWKELNG